MPSIQAKSYTVTLRRGVGGPPNALNSIRIVPAPVGDGSTINYVDLTYNGNSMFPVGHIPPSDPPNARRIFGYFPPEEFENHRVILQSEAPIEIEWQTDATDPNDLARLQVRSKQELPGQGPIDTS
jgi:hypothetical protein